MTLTSFVGGLLTILFLFSLVSRRQTSATTLLLVGVMVNFILAALMMFLLFAALPQETSRILYLWMGSFSGVWTLGDCCTGAVAWHWTHLFSSLTTGVLML